MDLAPGTLIGNYEIKHRLGAGGMGEVYFARDGKLGRYVAIKLLLPELTTNPDRLRRFKLEARTTSSLNHPNIVTLFEVGETDSLYYLVTEFIDGLTLRHYLVENTISLREILDITIQVTTALAAAQASGIVHRDIKPENIMRRTDGYVKVLDFGLAKLMPGPDGVTDEGLPTMNFRTDPGSVVGTVVYMSPEQLRGLDVDSRSDIWSLGVVLYEMIAGRQPFSGASKSDMIAAILREEPELLSKFSAETPVELEAIVSRMLRKDPARRYQTARELLKDLNELTQDLDLGSRLERKGVSSGRISQPVSTASVASEALTERVNTSKIPPARPTSGVEYLMSGIRRHRAAVLVGIFCIAAMLIAVVWLGFLRHRLFNRSSGEIASQVSEIMTASSVREAAISPDGKFIATVAEDGGKQSIRIQQPTNAGESRTLDTGDGTYRGLVFAPDSYSIYYISEQGQHAPALYQVAALGGALPRKLIDDVGTPITLSPDGSQLAFVRRSEAGADLLIANTNGTGVRQLAHTAGEQVFGTLNINTGPAWSPDGSVIACPMMSNSEPVHMTVAVVQVSDGSIKQIGSHQWFLIGQIAWLSDSRGLVMAAQEKMPPAATPQIWSLSYPAGEARSLTNDLSYYRGVSLAADGKTLVTIRSVKVSNLWMVPVESNAAPIMLAVSRSKGVGGLTWISDGSIVYSSAEAGAPELWTMNTDGNKARQLTSDKHTNVEPSIARNGGDSLVFVSYGTGQPHIWRMDRSGGNLRQLTNESYEDWPSVSPDGRWVVYHSATNDKDRLRKISIDGGESSLIFDQPTKSPAISPDGNWIACYLKEGEAWRLAILPFAGGQPIRTFEIPPDVADQWHGPRWRPDGQSISYIVTRGGVSNIWSQPVDGAAARQVTNFTEGQIIAFDWSLDGKRLVCTRGSDTRTLVLIKNLAGA